MNPKKELHWGLWVTLLAFMVTLIEERDLYHQDVMPWRTRSIALLFPRNKHL